MDLTADSIQKIVDLGAAEYKEFHGIQYCTKKLNPVTPPQIAPAGVATLGALRDYLGKNPDALELGKVIVHVAGHNTVNVMAVADPVYRTRETYLVAAVSHSPFRFGTYLPQDEFVIALQTFFQQDGNSDIAKVLQCVGNVADENVNNWGDDGVSQQVQAKIGIVQKAAVVVPNPVTLTPYRTFLEVSQPSSKFVLRMKQGSGAPLMALFEADGGNWKLEAIDGIKTWLEAELPENVTILA